MDPKVDTFWGRTTYLVVTGASRGIGRKISIEFSSMLGPNSTVLLLARSAQNLADTKKLISYIRTDIHVQILPSDFQKPNVEQFLNVLSDTSKSSKFDLFILVHNAGSIIVDIPTSEMSDVTKWNDYMTVNMYSAAALTSGFLKVFKEGDRVLVNISSLAAKKPFKGLGMYCVAKASREAYFKVLEEEYPSVKVLNYSPGPIDTDMFNEIADNCCFPDIKNNFAELKNTNKLVNIEDSVRKLIFLLKHGFYGCIDFYDEL